MVNYPMDPIRIMLVPNCSQIFWDVSDLKKQVPCQFWAPWSRALEHLWKETGPRSNKPTKPGQYEKPRKQIPTPPSQTSWKHDVFWEQMHRFASSLIPPNNGYIVVKVDGDRHSQVRWRFVFVNTWELRHLVCWWYGWWFRNPKQPPGMVLKPCK